MIKYCQASNFFEINMIKDYYSKKMIKITEKEIQFLQQYIVSKESNLLDVMCGYGRLANRLFDLGYENVDGIDLGNFDFINEKKKFKFYNCDFFKWESEHLYDFAYSLYNSYVDYNSFLDVINKCYYLLNEKGILIIDIFDKDWRDSISKKSYRVVDEKENEKVELFRYYDGINEKSIYRITNDKGINEFSFSQCVISKEKLKEIIPECWNVEILNSIETKTRDDNQKNILILRKKVGK